MRQLIAVLISILIYNSGYSQQGRPVRNSFPNCTFYSLNIPSFCDADDDSIGDLKGAKSKLDYLQTMGIEALILSPVYWTLDADKTAAIDFQTVDPKLGTLADLKELIVDAHKSGIKVLLTMNINYTGILHPWFGQLFIAENKIENNYYVLKSTATEKLYKKSWYAAKNSKQSYYSYRGAEYPCLNFENAAVKKFITDACIYWLKTTNADGIKFLDADKLCMNSDKLKHNFYSSFLLDLKKSKPGSIFIAQINDSYLNSRNYLPKQFDGVINYDLGKDLKNAITTENGNNLIINLNKQRDSLFKSSQGYFNLTQLNDETTDRLSSTLSPDMMKAGIGLLLTLPGSPVIFYGDEIGMAGLKKDRSNTEAYVWNFSFKDDNRATAAQNNINTDSLIVPYAIQVTDGNSLYNFCKKLILIKKENKILQEGIAIPLDVKNKNLVAFYRQLKNEKFLIIQNLSSQEQPVSNNTFSNHLLKLIYTNSLTNVNDSNELKLSPYSTTIYSAMQNK